MEKEAVAQERLDVAEANYKEALGELQRLQASLQRAELNLSYTDIKAPMDGRIGRFAFSVGDYVTPLSDPLAEIVKQDPMYVTFPVSTRVLLRCARAAELEGLDPAAVPGEAPAARRLDLRRDGQTQLPRCRGRSDHGHGNRPRRVSRIRSGSWSTSSSSA